MQIITVPFFRRKVIQELKICADPYWDDHRGYFCFDGGYLFQEFNYRKFCDPSTPDCFWDCMWDPINGKGSKNKPKLPAGYWYTRRYHNPCPWNDLWTMLIQITPSFPAELRYMICVWVVLNSTVEKTTTQETYLTLNNNSRNVEGNLLLIN